MFQILDSGLRQNDVAEGIFSALTSRPLVEPDEVQVVLTFMPSDAPSSARMLGGFGEDCLSSRQLAYCASC